MKKLLMLCILAISVLSTPVYAIETKNCDSLTGGLPRSLDYMSVTDLNNGDRAIVVYTSGVSYYLGYFKYDSTGTNAEDVTSHPFYVRPNDYTTGGVWYEVLANFVNLDADLSIDNLTVNSLLTVNDVAASGKLSGGVITHPLYDNWTISGITLFGGYISAVSEPVYSFPDSQGGVTVTVPTATGEGENFVIYIRSDTLYSGQTTFVQFTAGDSITSGITCTAGVSKYVLSGTTFSQRLVCISPSANNWDVVTFGSPTVEAD